MRQVIYSCSILLTIIVVSQAVPYYELLNEEWKTFKIRYGKKYSTDTEDQFRQKVYMESRNKIAKHNALFETGKVSFHIGINQFSDMLSYEVAEQMNGFNRTRKGKYPASLPHRKASTFVRPANVEIPDAVDWREAGAVTEVKDQGQCGSCWAFSATGALEGQHFRKTGVLTSLSEQNLIDCSSDYGNDGCNGGMMDHAFLYVENNGGIDTEGSYPYEAEDDTCRYSPAKSGATDTGYSDIASGDEERLKEAVATVGPISVAIDASHMSFQAYLGGIYYEPDCSSEELDHGVLVVGYGSENGWDYWLVKNSWGTSWGMDGYIKMARNRDNNCGIATLPSFPLV